MSTVENLELLSHQNPLELNLPIFFRIRLTSFEVGGGFLPFIGSKFSNPVMAKAAIIT
jgi:hypothetical protein